MTGVLLFDLDGTLVDADHLHFLAWKEMVEGHGVDLTQERYRDEIMGYSDPIILERLLPNLDAAQGQALVDEKEALFRSMAHSLKAPPGLVAFLDWAQGLGLQIGVVTNAPRLNAEVELRGIGLGERFDTIVLGQELEHGKPHPLPYQTGLKRLGGTAAQSVAFEDSFSGIDSATAAGVKVVGLTTGHPDERLIAAGASLAIADFSDPRLIPFVKAVLSGEADDIES